MGLFDFFKKQKTDVEQYYEERKAREAQQANNSQQINNTQYAKDNAQINPYDTQSVVDGQTFRITVQDVFSITGRGTVITGQIESGSVRVGDEVVIQRLNGNRVSSVVGGIEQFRKMLDYGKTGDNVGILLRNVTKTDVSKGDVITK